MGPAGPCAHTLNNLNINFLTTKILIMNKVYILILAFCLIHNTTEAQENLKFGVKAGINFSDYTGRGYNDFEPADSRTSYHVGILTEVFIAPKWNFQPELLYSEQGYIIRSNSNFSDELEIDLNYLQLPLIAEFGLANRFYLQGGPQFSYLLNKDSLPEDGANGIIFNYNSFDFSLIFGAEYRFQSFFVFGRYNAGINRIVNSSEVQTHNRVIQGGLGFFF